MWTKGQSLMISNSITRRETTGLLLTNKMKSGQETDAFRSQNPNRFLLPITNKRSKVIWKHLQIGTNLRGQQLWLLKISNFTLMIGRILSLSQPWLLPIKLLINTNLRVSSTRTSLDQFWTIITLATNSLLNSNYSRVFRTKVWVNCSSKRLIRRNN